MLIISFIFFLIIAYICGGDLVKSFYLLPIKLSGEVAVVLACVIGGCVGFLWYNAPPAKVFMGDTGSLSLGAFLGTVAVMLKQEFLLAIVGGIFVIEALSVMIDRKSVVEGKSVKVSVCSGGGCVSKSKMMTRESGGVET